MDYCNRCGGIIQNGVCTQCGNVVNYNKQYNYPQNNQQFQQYDQNEPQYNPYQYNKPQGLNNNENQQNTRFPNNKQNDFNQNQFNNQQNMNDDRNNFYGYQSNNMMEQYQQAQNEVGNKPQNNPQQYEQPENRTEQPIFNNPIREDSQYYPNNFNQQRFAPMDYSQNQNYNNPQNANNMQPQTDQFNNEPEYNESINQNKGHQQDNDYQGYENFNNQYPNDDNNYQDSYPDEDQYSQGNNYNRQNENGQNYEQNGSNDYMNFNDNYQQDYNHYHHDEMPYNPSQQIVHGQQPNQGYMQDQYNNESFYQNQYNGYYQTPEQPLYSEQQYQQDSYWGQQEQLYQNDPENNGNTTSENDVDDDESPKKKLNKNKNKTKDKNKDKQLSSKKIDLKNIDINALLKNKKLLFGIIIAIVVIFVLVSKIFGGSSAQTTGNEVGTDSPESAATYFVESALNENYEDVLKSLYVETDSNSINLLTPEDIEYGISTDESMSKVTKTFSKKATIEPTRKSDIEDNQVLLDVKMSEGNGEDAKTQTINLTAQKTENDKWYVVYDNIYVKDWEITVPHNIDVTINDTTKLNKKNIKITDTENTDHYIINYIGKKDVKVTMTSTNFGNYSTTGTPVSNEKTTFNFFISTNDCKEIIGALQTTYNNYMNKVANRTDASENSDIKGVVSEISGYFDSSIDQNLLSLYADYFARSNYSSVKMNYCTTGGSGTSTGYLTQDDEVKISFKYTTVFKDGDGAAKSMNRDSSIVLKYRPETKDYIISNIDDVGLFYVLDEEVNDWN